MPSPYDNRLAQSHAGVTGLIINPDNPGMHSHTKYQGIHPINQIHEGLLNPQEQGIEQQLIQQPQQQQVESQISQENKQIINKLNELPLSDANKANLIFKLNNKEGFIDNLVTLGYIDFKIGKAIGFSSDELQDASKYLTSAVEKISEYFGIDTDSNTDSILTPNPKQSENEYAKHIAKYLSGKTIDQKKQYFEYKFGAHKAGQSYLATSENEELLSLIENHLKVLNKKFDEIEPSSAIAVLMNLNYNTQKKTLQNIGFSDDEVEDMMGTADKNITGYSTLHHYSLDKVFDFLHSKANSEPIIKKDEENILDKSKLDNILNGLKIPVFNYNTQDDFIGNLSSKLYNMNENILSQIGVPRDKLMDTWNHYSKLRAAVEKFVNGGEKKTFEFPEVNTGKIDYAMFNKEEDFKDFPYATALNIATQIHHEKNAEQQAIMLTNLGIGLDNDYFNALISNKSLMYDVILKKLKENQQVSLQENKLVEKVQNKKTLLSPEEIANTIEEYNDKFNNSSITGKEFSKKLIELGLKTKQVQNFTFYNKKTYPKSYFMKWANKIHAQNKETATELEIVTEPEPKYVKNITNKYPNIKSFIPDGLLSEYKQEYDSDIGSSAGYTLKDHTNMVLGQFNKYYKGQLLPGNFNSNAFEALLALHDIGKPKAISEGNEKSQHENTVALMNNTLQGMGLKQSEINVCNALIHADVLGEYLQNDKSLEETVKRLEESAKFAGMNPIDFFDLELLLFKVDAGAYTEDAGGKKSLDHLFKFGEDGIGLEASVQSKIDKVHEGILFAGEPLPDSDTELPTADEAWGKYTMRELEDKIIGKLFADETEFDDWLSTSDRKEKFLERYAKKLKEYNELNNIPAIKPKSISTPINGVRSKAKELMKEFSTQTRSFIDFAVSKNIPKEVATGMLNESDSFEELELKLTGYLQNNIKEEPKKINIKDSDFNDWYYSINGKNSPDLIGTLFANHEEYKKWITSESTTEAKRIFEKAVQKYNGINTDINLDPSNFIKVGSQKGSNAGGLYKDNTTGKQYYVKHFDNNHRLADNENIANELYKLAGVPVANTSIGKVNNKASIISEMIDGVNPSINTIKSNKDIINNFVIDAWLANWDVAGADYDNLLLTPNNALYRIDNGGSLLYRAQGGSKNFTDEVTELESLRNPDINPTAANIFSDITYNIIKPGLDRLKKINNQDIHDIVNGSTAFNQIEKNKLINTLIKRKADILNKIKDDSYFSSHDIELYEEFTSKKNLVSNIIQNNFKNNEKINKLINSTNTMLNDVESILNSNTTNAINQRKYAITTLLNDVGLAEYKDTIYEHIYYWQSGSPVNGQVFIRSAMAQLKGQSHIQYGIDHSFYIYDRKMSAKEFNLAYKNGRECAEALIPFIMISQKRAEMDKQNGNKLRLYRGISDGMEEKPATKIKKAIAKNNDPSMLYSIPNNGEAGFSTSLGIAQSFGKVIFTKEFEPEEILFNFNLFSNEYLGETEYIVDSESTRFLKRSEILLMD